MSTSFSAHRLHKHADYQRVYGASRKQFGKLIAWFAAPREDDGAGPRIGLTVPKAMASKAVDRNRIKRRMRAAVGSQLSLLGARPVDVVLHPKRTVRDVEFAQLEREIALIFEGIATNCLAKPTHAHRKPSGAAHS